MPSHANILWRVSPSLQGTYGSSMEALGTAQIELQRAFDNVTEAATQGAKMKAGMETQSKASDTSDMV